MQDLSKLEKVEIIDVDHQPSFKYQKQILEFKDTTSMLLNLISHHLYGQYQHYWYGQVPKGYPESAASQQIRQNYQYFANLSHQPTNIKNL